MPKSDSRELKKVLKDENLRLPHGYELVKRKPKVAKKKKAKPKKKK